MTYTSGSSRTVQQYIDETPVWSDGTETTTVPLTRMQRRIWWLAAAGKFFEGLVVFMTGIALPLIVKEYDLDGSASHGLVTAATLAGILIGATALGGLSDRFGRKRMFIVEMAIFIAFLVGLTFTPNFPMLVIFLFGMGVALGCDYPTAHLVISEAIPSRSRGQLVLGAFAFQAVGGVFGAGIGWLILAENPSIEAWRWMYATAIVPAVAVLLGRLIITESPHWLFSQGRHEEAEAEAKRLLDREPEYPKEIRLSVAEASDVPRGEEGQHTGGFASLFRGKTRRATILASVPWFLQDLGTYGIGIFTPTILAAAVGQKTENAHRLADIVSNDILAAKGTAFLDLLLVAGIVFAIVLSDRLGRMGLQILGFFGCALGLFVAAMSQYFPDGSQWELILIFGGFMIFNFMTNMGPNAQTYLVAGEVFPTPMRGLGAGFAASFAKIGAVSTAFLFPILLTDIGTQVLLYILVGTSLLGALVTYLFRIETKGRSLEAVEF
ncbi:MFS transporter [Chachezhania antarctica]|uniref:MFS transporter n=1 Tax=Chachezhania antarctica TaxID=2340860 RepID=UPI000EB320D7|nr:MFS transporter [Chachezhania antarctica]